MPAKEPEPPPGAPDWIVTFADMISLLVTFFIMLMTFSSMEDFDVFRVQGNNTGTPGVLDSDGSTSSVKPPSVDIMAAKDAFRGAQLPHARPSSELLDEINDLGAKTTEEHTEVDLGAIRDGIRIRYDERASFRPGSDELEPHLAKSITELAEVLEHYPYTVIFEGHTDDAFKPTTRHATDNALAIARAQAAARLALESSELSPYQVQVSGYGASRPRADNADTEGRRLNRRVEVRVMALSEGRLAALERGDVPSGGGSDG